MTEELLNQIEQFLSGDMPQAEREAFEKRMAGDKNLKVLVEEVRELLLGIEAIGDNHLRGKITESIEDYRKTEAQTKQSHSKILTMKHTRQRNTAIRWLIAAAAVIIFGVIFFVARDDMDLTHEDMFTSVYKPDSDGAGDFLANLRSEGSEDMDEARKDSLAMGVVSYREHDYREAITILNQYITQYPDDQHAQYFLGISHLALANYKRTVELLQPLLDSDNHEVMDNARYYLALAYSKFDDNEINTQQLLQQIIEDPYTSWRKEAEQMSRFLN